MGNLSLFSHIVLQPTTLCNLNCRYCYLPDRDKVDVMTSEITEAIAESLAVINQQVCVVWHGGEPLATRINTFEELTKPFSNLYEKNLVRHNVQTNGTLINQAWCDFFKKWKFQVGVSLDGNEAHNQERVTITGAPAFHKIMRGIDLLKQNSISFSVIATVNPKNIDSPSSFYEFFTSLGCTSLNINIEEKEGFNQNGLTTKTQEVQKFWQELFLAWQKNPTIKIREIDMALGYISATLKSERSAQVKKHYGRGFWPTIASNGDMVVLSPEFLSVDESKRQQFIIGNVKEKPLHELVIEAQNAWYVKEFFAGIRNCKNTCSYYEFCGGGQASNKYFELGNIAGTETVHCQNSRKTIMDAVLNSFVS